MSAIKEYFFSVANIKMRILLVRAIRTNRYFFSFFFFFLEK